MSQNTRTVKPALTAILRIVVGLLFIGAFLFLPAGTINYWQA
jgi:TRAP-type C4-dicarboxylate transport system permease small subunit